MTSTGSQFWAATHLCSTSLNRSAGAWWDHTQAGSVLAFSRSIPMKSREACANFTLSMRLGSGCACFMSSTSWALNLRSMEWQDHPGKQEVKAGAGTGRDLPSCTGSQNLNVTSLTHGCSPHDFLQDVARRVAVRRICAELQGAAPLLIVAIWRPAPDAHLLIAKVLSLKPGFLTKGHMFSRQHLRRCTAARPTVHERTHSPPVPAQGPGEPLPSPPCSLA